MLKDVLTFASTGDLHELNPDDPIYAAMQNMSDFNVRHMLVVDNAEKLQGIFSGRDIIRLLGRDEGFEDLWQECEESLDDILAQPVSRIMLTKPITLSRNHTVYDAIKRMVAPFHQLESTVGSLPIVEGEKLIGIITERDILSIFQLIEQTVGKRAEFTPKTKVITADPTTTIQEAIQTLIKHHIRRLPVTRDEEVVGIVTSTDLVNANFLLNKPYSEILDAPLSGIMIKNIYYLDRGDSLEKAVNLMTKRNIGSLLYMDGDKLHGIITERDVLTIAYDLIKDL